MCRVEEKVPKAVKFPIIVLSKTENREDETEKVLALLDELFNNKVLILENEDNKVNVKLF